MYQRGTYKNISAVSLILIFLCIIILSCEDKPEPSSDRPVGTAGIDSVASADSVMIYYEVMGAGEPALVFVHCWCCDRNYWDGQVQEFVKQYQVVTIDLAGHGESGQNRRTWDMPSFGADVAAVVEKLGLDRAILIGHSMGGSVIVEAARLLPGKIIGLIGVDTYHDLSIRYSEDEITAFVSPYYDDFQSAAGNFIRTMFPPDADPTLVEMIVTDMSSAPSDIGIGALVEVLRYSYTDKIGLALKEVNLPVICINAGRYHTSLKAGQQLAPSFTALIMENVGHFLMFEDPVKFNALLHKAVKELAGESD